MSLKMSRKRRKVLERLAGEMREKKIGKQCTEEAQQEQQDNAATTSSNLVESLQLPGPSGMSIVNEGESDGDDYQGEFMYSDAQSCYEDGLSNP